LEAFSTAVRLAPSSGGSNDEELADRYRLAIELLIKRAWKKRRETADETIQELECYTEASPRLVNGTFDLSPKLCDAQKECCLADSLRRERGKLKSLRDAIPENSTRREDVRRRQALKQLMNTNQTLTREQCTSLGDAIFAFFAPTDADILTTNVRDHQPLAAAIGKTVDKP
jgi:hypothetical protein